MNRRETADRTRDLHESDIATPSGIIDDPAPSIAVEPVGSAEQPGAEADAANGDSSDSDPLSCPVESPVTTEGPLGEAHPSADERGAKVAPSRRVPASLPAVALVLLLFTLVGVGCFAVKNRNANALEAERVAAVQAARQLVVNLVTLDHTNPKASLDRVLDASTGDFRNQFSSQVGTIEGILAQAQVSSSGNVAEAGLARLSGDKAIVLVAASAVVKNSQTPNGAPRQYRMSVTLQRSSDNWLVSNVEFIP